MLIQEYRRTLKSLKTLKSFSRKETGVRIQKPAQKQRSEISKGQSHRARQRRVNLPQTRRVNLRRKVSEAPLIPTLTQKVIRNKQ